MASTTQPTDCAHRVSLREYIEARLNMIELNTAQAAASLDKRLDAMNEIRESLRDQSAKFLPRAEYHIQHEALATSLKTMELNRAKDDGKMVVIAALVAFAASIISSCAVALVLHLMGVK